LVDKVIDGGRIRYQRLHFIYQSRNYRDGRKKELSLLFVIDKIMLTLGMKIVR
jgi:hypothetical protein